jgi:hypothetical protein
MLLNGGETFSIGGAINGLTGTLVLNLDGTDVTFTADTTYAFDILAGLPYDITVTTQPAGQICTVNNASATPVSDVTDADVNCI